MSYTYATFQIALASMMAVPNNNVNDPNFVAILPTIVDSAEQRCYRDLDLLTAGVEHLFTMTPYVRAQTFNVGTSTTPAAQQILIIDRVTILPPNALPLPAPGTPPTVGGEPAYPATVDYIDAVYNAVYPNPAPAGRPLFFGMRDDQTIIFGPMPDQAYVFMLHGQTRPVPLYNMAPGDGSQSTFLTAVLPDLFLAAAMISASAYRHNFGAQSDDPKMAVSWEGQYQGLLPSARTEEMHKRFLGWGMMSSYDAPPPPSPAAPAG